MGPQAQAVERGGQVLGALGVAARKGVHQRAHHAAQVVQEHVGVHAPPVLAKDRVQVVTARRERGMERRRSGLAHARLRSQTR